MKTPLSLAAAAGLAALALSGCSLSTIPVPAELSASPRMPVEGRMGWSPKRNLRFGPYSTSPVRRSGTYVYEREGIVSTVGDHEQDFAFVLREGDEDMAEVRCLAEATAAVYDLPVVGEISSVPRSGLRCEIDPLTEGSTRWSLTLNAGRTQRFRGTLEGAGAARFDVAATKKLADSPLGDQMESTGFYIRRDSVAVAAVEVINHGGVWMRDEELDEEETIAVASAAAALLAFEALGDDFEPGERHAQRRAPWYERALGGVVDRTDAHNGPAARDTTRAESRRTRSTSSPRLTSEGDRSGRP